MQIKRNSSSVDKCYSQQQIIKLLAMFFDLDCFANTNLTIVLSYTTLSTIFREWLACFTVRYTGTLIFILEVLMFLSFCLRFRIQHLVATKVFHKKNICYMSKLSRPHRQQNCLVSTIDFFWKNPLERTIRLRGTYPNI